MIAQIITYNSQSTGLLVAQPNWETEVTISLELPTDIAKEPITFYESRRAFAQSARYNMQWRAYLPDAKDATELRIFLTRVRGEPILVPLWTDVCEIATNVPIGGSRIVLVDLPARYGAPWIIGNSDFSKWEIVSAYSLSILSKELVILPGTKQTWPPGSFIYPLITGRLIDRPKPESITDETFEVDLHVKENSDFAARLSTQAGVQRLVGTHISKFALTPLFDVAPNHVQPLDWTEQPDVIYEEIGFLRQEQQRVFDHRNARGLEFEFYQNNRTDLSSIERFWRAQRGPVLRFMVPTWRGDMRMQDNTPVPLQPTWINVETTEFCNSAREPQPGDPYIALIGPDNSVDPYELASTFRPPPAGPAGVPDRLVATTAVEAHTAASTILSNLLLARFVESSLQWTYTTPYLGTARIKIVDLPHEYYPTPPALPEPAYLFIFTEVGVRTDRFTSYENSIFVISGAWAGFYTPAPFSFQALKTGLKLDQEKLDFKSFPFDGNPLSKMWPFALDGLLTLDVVEVVATAPLSTTAKHRFSGEVSSVDSEYKATAIAFGNFFDRMFPRFLLSVSDNYTEFTPPTMLSALAFKITGLLTSTNDQTIVVNSTTANAKEADYFSGGWLEIGTGVNFERRGILHSEPFAASGVTLHIDRPLLKNVVAGFTPGPFGPQLPAPMPTPEPIDSLSIDLYPGYDGSIDQCATRFNNRINFGGHAYIPNVNPAVKAMKAKPVSGGKK